MFYIRYADVNNLYTEEYNGSQSKIVLGEQSHVLLSECHTGRLLLHTLPLSTRSASSSSRRNNLRAPYLIQSAIGVERQLNRRTTLRRQCDRYARGSSICDQRC